MKRIILFSFFLLLGGKIFCAQTPRRRLPHIAAIKTGCADKYAALPVKSGEEQHRERNRNVSAAPYLTANAKIYRESVYDWDGTLMLYCYYKDTPNPTRGRLICDYDGTVRYLTTGKKVRTKLIMKITDLEDLLPVK